MPDPVTAIGAAVSIGGSVLSSSAQAGAAERASSAQVEAAQLGIDENRRQFDTVRELLDPFVKGGTTAQGAQLALLGLGGEGEEEAAIQRITEGSQFQNLSQQGENAILQNASATGGLRGGNTQGALGQFRPQLLNQLIQSRLNNLGGVAAAGQNAAAGVGTAAQQTGAANSALIQQQGAARAGSALAQGQASANLFGNISGSLGNVLGSVPTSSPLRNPF